MTNIKDLAEMAGVSVTTVSRVLNDYPYVSTDKRNAVLKAIDETNYHKNINAVHLSRGSTKLIGVVLPYTDIPYFTTLLNGIANQALENDHNLVLFQTDYNQNKELEALQMMKEKQIDGLIITSRQSDIRLIGDYADFGPIALLEGEKDIKASFTYVNHYETFYQALEYLYGKGHTRIGFTLSRRSGSNSSLREQAYLDFLREYNMTFRPEYIMDDCIHIEDGRKVVERINQMEEAPTAIVATSDLVAAGTLIACCNQGVAVPGNLAVLSFDNQPVADMMDITTIEIPLEEMGRNLVRQVLGSGISSVEVDVRMIERNTV